MKINQNYLPPQNFAVISTLLLKLHTRNVRVKEHFGAVTRCGLFQRDVRHMKRQRKWVKNDKT